MFARIFINALFFTTVTFANEAYLLDVGGYSSDEAYFVRTLQGLVNRDEPRLYLTHSSAQCAGAGLVFAEYLIQNKGFHFKRLNSLDEAANLFCQLKKKDGSPLVNGFVLYNTWIGKPRYHTAWIAANIASLENLLPVSPSLLKGENRLTKGTDFWTDDTTMQGWSEFFSRRTVSTNGLDLQSVRKEYFPQRGDEYVTKWVELDLARTPRIEVTVSAVEGGCAWGLAIDMGTTIDLYNSSSATAVAHDRTDTGVFVFDLKAMGKFKPESGRAQIRLLVMRGQGSVQFSRVRFLDAKGQAVEPVRPVAPDWRKPFSVKVDLTDENTYPEMADSETAAGWAVTNLMPRCSRKSVLFMPEFVLPSLDVAVAGKAFIFYQKHTPYADPFPLLEQILSHLEAPATVLGWLENESYYIHKVGAYGHAQAWASENLSFWKHVPFSEKYKLPVTRKIQKLEKKVYVNFGNASGDVIVQQAGLMSGLWPDPNRGKVPITWGYNPLLAEFAPAMMEYYARNATPNDSFWSGPSGAGYTSVSAMSPEQVKVFAEKTRACMSFLGGSAAIDAWDALPVFYYRHLNKPFTQMQTCSLPPADIIIPCGWRDKRNKLNYWTEEGVPVFYPDTLLRSLWQEPKSGVDCTSEETMVADITARILAVADRVGEAPFFLTLNIRWSPTVLYAVMKRLPKERFEVVGMDDFIALAQQAGRLHAEAQSDFAVSGKVSRVILVIRNPTAQKLSSGQIACSLPREWQAVEKQVNYKRVEPYSVVKKTLDIRVPESFTNGTAELMFADQSVPLALKRVTLLACKETRLIYAPEQQRKWKAFDGAKVQETEEGLEVKPREIVYDSWKQKAPEQNGTIVFDCGEVDFERQPMLLVKMTDNFGNTRLSMSDGVEPVRLAETSIPETLMIDLKTKANGYKGQKAVSLTIATGVTWGQQVVIARIELGYLK